MILIIFILIVYGLANTIVNESVFRKPVEWLKKRHSFINDLLSCTTCISFYIGVGVFLMAPVILTGIIWIDMLLAGLIASGAINIIEHLKIKLGM